MNLTLDQKQALDRGNPVALTVEGKACVLLSMEVYEEIEPLLSAGDLQKEEIDLLADEAVEMIEKTETVAHFDET